MPGCQLASGQLEGRRDVGTNRRDDTRSRMRTLFDTARIRWVSRDGAADAGGHSRIGPCHRRTRRTVRCRASHADGRGGHAAIYGGVSCDRSSQLRRAGGRSAVGGAGYYGARADRRLTGMDRDDRQRFGDLRAAVAQGNLPSDLSQWARRDLGRLCRTHGNRRTCSRWLARDWPMAVRQRLPACRLVDRPLRHDGRW